MMRNTGNVIDNSSDDDTSIIPNRNSETYTISGDSLFKTRSMNFTAKKDTSVSNSNTKSDDVIKRSSTEIDVRISAELPSTSPSKSFSKIPLASASKLPQPVCNKINKKTSRIPTFRSVSNPSTSPKSPSHNNCHSHIIKYPPDATERVLINSNSSSLSSLTKRDIHSPPKFGNSVYISNNPSEIRQLDIPPDDITNEDYVIEDSDNLIDVDQLPHPPDELLRYENPITNGKPNHFNSSQRYSQISSENPGNHFIDHAEEFLQNQTSHRIVLTNTVNVYDKNDKQPESLDRSLVEIEDSEVDACTNGSTQDSILVNDLICMVENTIKRSDSKNKCDIQTNLQIHESNDSLQSKSEIPSNIPCLDDVIIVGEQSVDKGSDLKDESVVDSSNLPGSDNIEKSFENNLCSAFVISSENTDGEMPVKTVNSDCPNPEKNNEFIENDIEIIEISNDTIDQSLHKDADKPSACRLATRLYNLEAGFTKYDVAKHLRKKDQFSFLVGEEYINHFNFEHMSLDSALRMFLTKLVLTGETQERERVLLHFSKRYTQCNPSHFHSDDACHTLTCALILLNTDLHGANIMEKMSLSDFIVNLAALNDGDNFAEDILNDLYYSIKNNQIELEVEEYDDSTIGSKSSHTYGNNSPVFLEVPDPSKIAPYKSDYLTRKCCLEISGKKTPKGKRSWKRYYAILRDLVLYLYKDEQAANNGTPHDHVKDMIKIHHSLSKDDLKSYTKKQGVFQLQTCTNALYLFQASNGDECKDWVSSLNFKAASLSSPPLPVCGSQKTFQKAFLPSSYTKLNLADQFAFYKNHILNLEKDLHEHSNIELAKKSKGNIIQNHNDKKDYLEYEMERFRTYHNIMQLKCPVPPELEGSLVETSIGEVEEPPPSPAFNNPQTMNNETDNNRMKKKVERVYKPSTDRYSYHAAIYNSEQLFSC